MYIQAEKDEIGDVSDVTAMFKASKEPKDIIIIPDALRFEHYKYPAEHPERVIEFFDQYLADKSEKKPTAISSDSPKSRALSSHCFGLPVMANDIWNTNTKRRGLPSKQQTTDNGQQATGA